MGRFIEIAANVIDVPILVSIDFFQGLHNLKGITFQNDFESKSYLTDRFMLKIIIQTIYKLIWYFIIDEFIKKNILVHNWWNN